MQIICFNSCDRSSFSTEFKWNFC
uniref:Uncharacterized protein n=1 Tax=Arundo donax TaxID=35708 RepID=A0A0A9ASU3_ARUDO